jgi:hypothetical protein
MKKMIFVLFALILIGVPFISHAGSWSGLKTQWNEYLSFPSPENLEKFTKTLSSLAKDKGASSDKKETLEYLFQNSGRLFGKIQAQDSQAVRAGFLLLGVTDGGFKIKLNSDLGVLSSENPKLFLEGLKENRSQVQDLKALLTTLTDVYSKDPGAPEQQRLLRIRVLKSVDAPELNSTREECLKVLGANF